MDAFDYIEDPDEKPKRDSGKTILRLGALYFFASSLCLIGFFAYTYLNPHNEFNPFRPPLPAAQVATATIQPSATAVPLPTDTQTPPPTATLNLRPSATPVPVEPTPTDTPIPYPTSTTVVMDTPEVTDTPTAAQTIHFAAQEGTPIYIPHASGCDGLFIAGNVTDIHQNPLVHMIVRVTGTLNGETISVEDALSGSNQNYSLSGWEIKISDTVIESSGTVVVELYNQGTFDPVSDPIAIDTFASCTQNLVMVNFIQDQ